MKRKKQNPKPVKKQQGNILPKNYKTVTTLAELSSYVAPAEVRLDRMIQRGEKIEGFTLVGRRPLPGEAQEIKVLLDSAMPPQLPPESGSLEPRYDFRDPAYVQTKNMNERKARAYGLIKCYPLFAEAFAATGAPNTLAEMQKFMDGVNLEDAILNDAFTEITRNVIGVDYERVNFISGGRSLKS